MAPRVTKSLGRAIFNALNATPAGSALIPFVPASWALGQNIEHTTVANLISGGGAALDIGLRRATVTLNNAQIIALPTAPVTVAAGIPGRYLVTLMSIFKKDFTVGYTNTNNNGALFGFSDSFNAGLEGWSLIFGNVTAIALTSFFDFFNTADVNVWTLGSPYMYPAAHADLISGIINNAEMTVTRAGGGAAGADLTLKCDNAGMGVFTAGDIANSLVIETLYWAA